jgi:hypothetical protein
MAPHPRRTNGTGAGTLDDRASRPVSHRGEFDHIRFPLNLLCGFAPFVVFTVVSRLSISLALWTALAVSFALGLPVFLHTQKIRTLDGGGVALFGLAAILAGVLPALSNFNTARLVVILGMLATVLASFVLGEPFAFQYTLEEPDLARGARAISVSWACTFAVMSVADTLATYVPAMPETLVLLVNLAAVVAATTFTVRYAQSLRRKIA